MKISIVDKKKKKGGEKQYCGGLLRDRRLSLKDVKLLKRRDSSFTLFSRAVYVEPHSQMKSILHKDKASLYR